MKIQIDIPEREISDFCKKWKIVELALFGSVLRDDFRPDSDIDILVRFPENSGYSLFDMVHMQDELAAIFGRKVDLVSWKAVENSRNKFRSQPILESARLLYAA